MQSCEGVSFGSFNSMDHHQHFDIRHISTMCLEYSGDMHTYVCSLYGHQKIN